MVRPRPQPRLRARDDSLRLRALAAGGRPLYPVSVGYGALIAVAVVSVLVGEWLTVSGQRRRQLTLLLFGWLVLSVGGVFTIADTFAPLDPTPIAFTVTASVFTYALNRYQFLQLNVAGHETILDTLTDPVIVSATDGTIVETNAAADRLSTDGTVPAGVSVGDAFVDRPSVVRCVRDGRDDAIELVVDGETRHYRPARLPIQYGRNVIGVLTFLRDVTTESRREQQLQRQNDRLDQFANVVSHDLRNPLHVADSTLALAADSGDTGRIADARTHLSRMEEMIHDLLVMARNGQTVDETTAVTLEDAAAEAWAHADIADCEFEYTVPSGTRVDADRDRLLHVFENLYRNAADHNDSPVTVRVGALGDHDGATDGGRAGLFVEDTGTGIPDEQRDEIFERGVTTSDGGTGFGLSIVRDIVEAHGWEIRVTDGSDGGARFEITGVDIDH
ncbi:ATP-binding protein [Halomicroarcula sp. GCM10025709]|uniref:sensor histidine kinase n=1 Tax=Halomicroarcula sp. GCM10025709 TaxID=3252669 RepID=UPI0036204BAF